MAQVRAFELLGGSFETYERDGVQIPSDEPKVNGKVVRHERGSIVYSHEDLCAKHVNMFRERVVLDAVPPPPTLPPVPPPPAPVVKAAVVAQETPAPVVEPTQSTTEPKVGEQNEEQPETDDDKGPGEEATLGKEETESFPDAKSHDLRVFKDGEGKKERFYVTEKETPTSAVNKEKLKSPAAVVEFIEKYTAK